VTLARRLAGSPLCVISDPSTGKLVLIPCWEIFRFCYTNMPGGGAPDPRVSASDGGDARAAPRLFRSPLLSKLGRPIERAWRRRGDPVARDRSPRGGFVRPSQARPDSGRPPFASPTTLEVVDTALKRGQNVGVMLA